jgi:Xaa-Pro aminopeptidase
MPGGYLPSRLRGMTADLASRIRRVQDAMAAADVAGLVVTPGSDLRYLTG